MNPGDNHLTVRVLGYPELRWENERLKPPTQKSLAMLCCLAVRKQPVSREELTELLWTPAAGRNLRTELHRLRSLPGAGIWLHAGSAVELLAATDLEAFERAVVEERFEEALGLHPLSETLLRGLEPSDAPAFNDWLEVERARVNALLGDALQGRARELEREGSIIEALALVRHLIERDPLDESAYRMGMRLEYRRGHFEAALSHFETCRRVLIQELGLEPLPETLELAREIERGGPISPARIMPPKPRLPLKLLRPPVLVGREREWARIEAAWEARQTIYVSGPPGVGKTRLMLDFARSKGPFLISEGRPGDEAIPYSSGARAFRDAFQRHPDMKPVLLPWVKAEMARYMPDIFDEKPDPVRSAEDRLRLVEAMAHVLRVMRTKVDTLVVDDLQFYDSRSFEVGSLAQARLMGEKVEGRWARFLAGFRTGELPAGAEAILAQMVEAGVAAHVELEPLGEDAVREMLLSLDLEGVQDLAPRLHGLTGGNPLFIIETLKSLYETGDLAAGIPERISLPDKVTTILTKRLGTLGEAARRVVQALAAFPQDATPERLAAVLERDPYEVIERLGELERAQLLREGRFAHDLLYEAVIAATPKALSRLLHRRIAEVLGQSGAGSSRIAYHLQQAGEIEQAVRHWLEAARAYQAAGLHEGALDLLGQVVTHTPDAKTRQEAQLELVSSYLELGRDEEARQAVEPLLHEALSPRLAARAFELTASIQLGQGRLQEAATLAERGSGLGSAVGNKELRQRLTLLRARTLHRAERHQEALELLTPLLEELRQGPPSTRLARVLSEVAALHDNLGRSEEALPLHYGALELAHELGAAHHRVIATNHLVYCLIELGRPEDAIAPGEAVLASGTYRFSDLLRINLARAYLLLERYEDAKRHCLHLCETSADPALCAAAWARLAEIYSHLSQKAEAKRALKQAGEGLRHTDYPRAHARVAIATLRYGTKAQKKAIAPYLEALDLEVLPGYLKDDLKALLA
jgi:DNA-binding SARP family transcriptional activator